MGRSEHHRTRPVERFWRFIAQRKLFGGRYTGNVEQESLANANVKARDSSDYMKALCLAMGVSVGLSAKVGFKTESEN